MKNMNIFLEIIEKAKSSANADEVCKNELSKLFVSANMPGNELLRDEIDSCYKFYLMQTESERIKLLKSIHENLDLTRYFEGFMISFGVLHGVYFNEEGYWFVSRARKSKDLALFVKQMYEEALVGVGVNDVNMVYKSLFYLLDIFFKHMDENFALLFTAVDLKKRGLLDGNKCYLTAVIFDLFDKIKEHKIDIESQTVRDLSNHGIERLISTSIIHKSDKVLEALLGIYGDLGKDDNKMLRSYTIDQNEKMLMWLIPKLDNLNLEFNAIVDESVETRKLNIFEMCNELGMSDEMLGMLKDRIELLELRNVVNSVKKTGIKNSL